MSAQAPERIEAPFDVPPTESGRSPHPPPRARALRKAPPTRLSQLEGPAARLGDIARVVVRRIRQRPLTALAAAIGVGFVVGGALSFRAGRLALAVAARHVGRELLKQVL